MGGLPSLIDIYIKIDDWWLFAFVLSLIFSTLLHYCCLFVVDCTMLRLANTWRSRY